MLTFSALSTITIGDMLDFGFAIPFVPYDHVNFYYFQWKMRLKCHKIWRLLFRGSMFQYEYAQSLLIVLGVFWL